jgi:hypothetical protein
MKTARAIVISMALCLMAGPATAAVDIGLSIDEDGIKGFYLAIGEHYTVPQTRIEVVRKQNIPDDELPVVFFLARHADCSPALIVKMRLGGKSWMDIAIHFGLNAELFYVPLKEPGPPYGKAWGHFKKNKKGKRKAIRLTDTEIVAFVNLKFISQHYGHSPDEVAKMRSNGKSFVKINGEVKKKRAAKKSLAAREKSKEKSKAKGKGKKK